MSLAFMKMARANAQIWGYTVECYVFSSHCCNPGHPTPLCYRLYLLSMASFPSGKPKKSYVVIQLSSVFLVWLSMTAFHTTRVSHLTKNNASSWDNPHCCIHPKWRLDPQYIAASRQLRATASAYHWPHWMTPESAATRVPLFWP